MFNDFSVLLVYFYIFENKVLVLSNCKLNKAKKKKRENSVKKVILFGNEAIKSRHI